MLDQSVQNMLDRGQLELTPEQLASLERLSEIGQRQAAKEIVHGGERPGDAIAGQVTTGPAARRRPPTIFSKAVDPVVRENAERHKRNSKLFKELLGE